VVANSFNGGTNCRGGDSPDRRSQAGPLAPSPRRLDERTNGRERDCRDDDGDLVLHVIADAARRAREPGRWRNVAIDRQTTADIPQDGDASAVDFDEARRRRGPPPSRRSGWASRVINGVAIAVHGAKQKARAARDGVSRAAGSVVAADDVDGDAFHSPNDRPAILADESRQHVRFAAIDIPASRQRYMSGESPKNPLSISISPSIKNLPFISPLPKNPLYKGHLPR